LNLKTRPASTGAAAEGIIVLFSNKAGIFLSEFIEMKPKKNLVIVGMSKKVDTKNVLIRLGDRWSFPI
jgi:hypothetical protein